MWFAHWEWALILRMGISQERIHEADWYDRLELEKKITIHVLPARHYSGRLMSKNKTLWAGFALETGKRRLFFSGDSGYGPHFSEIGRKFSGFDLVFLDCG
jgi:L-ascorbate metabolism protein UlaG (beta-lactamase superfamily)